MTLNETSSKRRERKQASFLSVTIFALVLLGISAVVFLGVKDPDQKTIFSDLFSPIIESLTLVSLLLAARHSAARSKRLAWAWGLISLSTLFYMVGDIIWGILELVLKQTPFPSLADPFYLANAPLFFAGVVLLSTKPVSRIQQLNNTLDLATILAVAILGFWNFLLAPTLTANIESPLLDQVILLSYPISDLVLIGALLLIVYNDPAPQDIPSIALLGAELLIVIVTDSIYTYQGLLGTYVSGGPLDLGWVLDTLLLGLAAAAQWTITPWANRSESSKATSRTQGILNAIKKYLPYLWIMAAFAMLIMRALIPLPMSFLDIALGTALIMALVLARQLITLSENNKLNNQLMTQATSLARTNRDLNAEIAERLRMGEKLSYDALHDAMTGLANRALFVDRLGQAIQHSKRHHEQSFAVLFLDLDKFKFINDSLGHLFGDQLLIAVAKRLKETLRSTDTVARFGGDEFAILLDETNDEKQVRLVAESVQASIIPPFKLKEREVHMTASIGIATDVIKYDRPEDLLRDVDLAMYQAKALGKGRSEMFAVHMRDQAFSRLELEEDLHRGLERREFEIYYQPIKFLKSDEIVGVEALLRWRHPAKGMLLPEEFLTIAEESGLIMPIGDWVLNQACVQMKTWQQEHVFLQNASVSVNLSDKQFSHPNLAEKIASALSASGLKPTALRLEITERVLVSNFPMANRVMEELQDMGVQVQIDDFGTGYSALAYLQQFPIDALKIDKSFIDQMNIGSKGLGLLKAIISMARELGMEAIAEGIETTEQLDVLKGLSCGYGQGFLLSVPMDAATLEKTFAKPKKQ